MFSPVKNTPRSTSADSTEAPRNEARGTPAGTKRARTETVVQPRANPSATRAPRATLPDAPVLKTNPYYPIDKGRSSVNHNCRVEVGDGLAKCRHFASAYVVQALAGPSGTQAFLNTCKDPGSIRTFFQDQGGLASAEPLFDTMAFGAPSEAKHLVSADRLGAYLTEVANELDAGGGSADLACFLLCSETHAMAVKVERKCKEDKGTYFAVSVYDPNVPGNHVRVEAESAEALGSLKFRELAAFADAYLRHPKDPKLVAVAQNFVVDKLPAEFSADLDSHAVHLALSLGMPESLKLLGADLLEHKNEFGADGLRELLSAKSQAGAPALHVAMIRPETGAIKAYGELLALAQHSLGLPEADVVDLLGAHFEGNPALALSMHCDRPDAIRSFAGVLKSLSLPKRDLLALLSPHVSDGNPALRSALLTGKSEVVTAYGDALGQFDLAPGELVPLLASGIDGSRGLVNSLKHNGPEVVQSVAAAVAKLGLAAEAMADIYASKDADGTPILHHMLELNQLGSMEDLREVFRALDPPAETLAALLAGKDAIGVPALHSAMREGNTDAVRAFGQLLRGCADKLDVGQLSELLAAEDPLGSTGVRVASKLGHADTVAAFHEVWQDVVNRRPPPPPEAA
jgi:hypothetical protein